MQRGRRRQQQEPPANQCRCWECRARWFRGWFESHDRTGSVPSEKVAHFFRFVHRSHLPQPLADALVLYVESFVRACDNAAGVTPRSNDDAMSDDQVLRSFRSEHGRLMAAMESRGTKLQQIRLPSARERRLIGEIEKVKEKSRKIARTADDVEVAFSDGKKALFVPDDEQKPRHAA